MLQLTCPHCQRSVEYSSDRPRFCSFCGGTLSTVGSTPPEQAPTRTASPLIERTQHFDPIAETLPPLPGGMTATTPEIIGGYRLGRRLGSGGMGSVHEAEHVQSGQRVALKLIKSAQLSSEAVARFRLEGRLASTISHPRCVFVLAADEEAGQPYIVMELMPGSTLTDLIVKRGPLPIQEAIHKILDVIEGLQEAHRLGVIHRDVKPSNCFLELDGRVKVGDFGLAKMQTGDNNLTRTGMFIGTVLFASPEQIKCETLDQQADVYSVAATLYYLLTGKAPFSDVDALAATARIVSEDPPPMRSLRPDVPEALDRIVLRGLARDKANRWQNLDSLHAALMPFIPGQMPVGAIGYRFGAYLIDWLILTVIQTVVALTVLGRRLNSEELTGEETAYGLLIGFCFFMAYFGLCERLLGFTVGKWVFRLRVSEAVGAERPSWIRVALRTGVFWLNMNLDTLLVLPIVIVFRPNLKSGKAPSQHDLILAFVIMAVQLGGFVVKCVLPLTTMRRRNGYRGPHEFASGTRVIQIPEKGLGPSFQHVEYSLPLSLPEGLPVKIGSFAIQGAIRWDDQEKMLLADDPMLGRKVWIWLRPTTESDLDETRRMLSRPTRMRWVASGLEGNWKWDAFLAPTGFPLYEAIRQTGPLDWSAAQPVIEQLIEELAVSADEGTLPTPLTQENVWVYKSGRLKLVGSMISRECSTVPAPEDTSDDAVRGLIANVAALMLEGKPRGPAQSGPIRAPLPRGTAAVLNRFWDQSRQFKSLGGMRKALGQLRERPSRVNRPRRIINVLILALLAVVPFSCIWSILFFGPVFIPYFHLVDLERDNRNLEFTAQVDLAANLLRPDPIERIEGVRQYSEDLEHFEKARKNAEKHRRFYEARLRWSSFMVRRALVQQEEMQSQLSQEREYGRWLRMYGRFDHDVEYPFKFMPLWIALPALLVVPAFWIVWGFISRGGLALYFNGMELVRRDGRKASFLQCLLRGLLFWTPLMAMWGVSIIADVDYWSHWQDSDPSAGDWLMLLSWVFWWGGVVLLAVYFALIVWRPERSWYDRLVGVWIMPR